MRLEYVTTTYENNKKETKIQEISFVPDEGREDGLLNLYPQVKYQTMEGFGGAMTDSAGYIFSLLKE